MSVRQFPWKRWAGQYLVLPGDPANPLATECLVYCHTAAAAAAVQLRALSSNMCRSVCCGQSTESCSSSNAAVLQLACESTSANDRPSALHISGVRHAPAALQQLAAPQCITKKSTHPQQREHDCMQWQRCWQQHSFHEPSWHSQSHWWPQHCTATISKHPALPPPVATTLQAIQHHWQLPHRCFHSQAGHRRRSQEGPSTSGLVQEPSAAPQTAEAQQQQQQQHAPGASFSSLPNLLSLSRVASGPWVAYLIATQQWPLAVGLIALAGATDWLDGHLARRLGHTSKLGSYLDPLADKVLIGSVVGTMGYLGMVPTWLAVMVVGRDTAQVVGMFWYRLKMFGSRWPGAVAFFDVDGSGTFNPAAGAGASITNSSGSSTTEIGAAVPVALPQMRPLMVSKVNTALVLALIAGCMTQQWQAVPGQDVLDLLEYAAAGTTAVSAVAYVRLYRVGKLLPAVGTQRQTTMTETPRH